MGKNVFFYYFLYFLWSFEKLYEPKKYQKSEKFSSKGKNMNHNAKCNMHAFYNFWYFFCLCDNLSELKK